MKTHGCLAVYIKFYIKIFFILKTYDKIQIKCNKCIIPHVCASKLGNILRKVTFRTNTGLCFELGYYRFIR